MRIRFEPAVDLVLSVPDLSLTDFDKPWPSTLDPPSGEGRRMDSKHLSGLDRVQQLKQRASFRVRPYLNLWYGATHALHGVT